MSEAFETVIGLEVHLQFNTKTKNFCGCANEFGKEPNTLTCPVCLGLPGSLPVLNEVSLLSAIKVALALSCEVNSFIKFDRKNYYYPDLPKSYQISQYDLPIARNGFVMIPEKDSPRKIRVHRAHLEEDAGKLIHDTAAKASLVDYNRAGTPLMEIVTEPDIRSAQEAYDYLQTLKLILQYLNVSDCDMEKGSLRCDANISIRPQGETKLGTKTELKNMNSFKAVKAAIEFEEDRQRQAVASGERIVQETRLWDETKGMTFVMRSKEEAHDYRYFPEPDLVPFIVEQKTIDQIRDSLPELPDRKLERFLSQYKLLEYDAQILIQDVAIADFFEECAKHYPQTKKICNWLIGPLQEELNNRKVALPELRLTAKTFVGLIEKVEEGIISNLVGKEILPKLITTGKTADEIIQQEGLAQVSDDAALNKIIDDVLAENPKVLEQISSGKQNAMGFLVGQAMRKTNGKANPKKLSEIIQRRLSHG